MRAETNRMAHRPCQQVDPPTFIIERQWLVNIDLRKRLKKIAGKYDLLQPVMQTACGFDLSEKNA
jgi:hypothetical protein